eukprot:1317587-Prymnesium_polylepis.1
MGRCTDPNGGAPSTRVARNRIVRGKEIAFDADGIRNAHFRRLALQAMSNASNISNVSASATSDAASSNDQPAGAAGNARCSDVAGAFASVSLCVGGDQCANGMFVAAPLFGGMAVVCETT